MNISNVLAGATDLAKTVHRVNPLAAGANSAASSSKAASPSDASASALREILAKYDVTDITPDQFSQMIQKLSDSGVISKKEIQDLAAVRADLEKAGVESDESVNLVDFYRQLIKQAQRESDKSPNMAALQQLIQPMNKRLDWLEKFATLQANPDSASVSALA